jgi:hypothetical protein
MRSPATIAIVAPADRRTAFRQPMAGARSLDETHFGELRGDLLADESFRDHREGRFVLGAGSVSKSCRDGVDFPAAPNLTSRRAGHVTAVCAAPMS